MWSAITGRLKWCIQRWNPIVTVLAVVIGFLGFVIALLGLKIANDQKNLAVQLAYLDFHPKIRVATRFRTPEGIQPYYTLHNVGSVAAVQVRVQVVSHRFFPQTGEVQIQMRESKGDAYIDKLEPREERSISFWKGWLDSNARLQKLPECNAMELRITYRRSQDLEDYGGSAFYFVSPAGRWVSERDSALSTDLCRQVRAAVLRAASREVPFPIYDDYGHDPLHQF